MRVVGRDGVSRESVAARMRHQAEDAELLSIANHVIENNGSIEDLSHTVQDLYHRLVGNKKAGAGWRPT
jgi:dephospho-CoA kinase